MHIDFYCTCGSFPLPTHTGPNRGHRSALVQGAAPRPLHIPHSKLRYMSKGPGKGPQLAVPCLGCTRPHTRRSAHHSVLGRGAGTCCGGSAVKWGCGCGKWGLTRGVCGGDSGTVRAGSGEMAGTRLCECGGRGHSHTLGELQLSTRMCVCRWLMQTHNRRYARWLPPRAGVAG